MGINGFTLVLIFYWSKVHGNEDGNGLSKKHTIPPNRRLAQLDLWGCSKRSLLGGSSVVVATDSYPVGHGFNPHLPNQVIVVFSSIL